jgi:hypothetical protein
VAQAARGVSARGSWSASAGAQRLDLRRRERHTGDVCRGRAPGEVAEQDDNVQACVCGCGAGGALWNGLRELERGARGAGMRRHTYAEVSARLSAMAQGWSSGLAVPRRGDSARTRTGKAMEPREGRWRPLRRKPWSKGSGRA